VNVTQKSADIELYAQTKLPLIHGVFDVSVFRSLQDQTEHVLLSMGDFGAGTKPPFLRVHSECFTGEILGSLRCDCKSQLDIAIETIAREGRGLLIYIRNHEGRGIGLGNKIRAYELQRTKDLDTLQANHALGFPDDLRNFSIAVKILKFLKLFAVRLNTNNPEKVSALETEGINIVELIPSLSPINQHNDHYLRTKLDQLGHHHLGSLFSCNI
jgi:GTP cyclohydrolase II